jgi:competence protein ComEA
LAARLQDGEQVWIGLTAADGSNAHTESTSGPAGGLININTASRAELESLSGIGPSTAEKIMAYREANGPFESIEDIMDVSGIGPSTFGRIQDAITIEP